MSIESQVKAAFATMGHPIENSVYTGDAETYFVFQIFSNPADFGDDTPHAEVHRIYLHLFAPLDTNLTALIGDVKRAAQAAGFTYPSITSADDADGRHRVFEMEAVTETALGG